MIAELDLILPALKQLLQSGWESSELADYPAIRQFYRFATPQVSSSQLDEVIYADSEKDLPLAADLARKNKYQEGYWVCARPVILQPDRDCLLLTRYVDDCSAQQLESLIEILKSHFIDDFESIRLADNFLLIKLSKSIRIKTHSYVDALGKNIDKFLPSGDQKQYLHGLLNEIQMLIFQHSMNFNALWFEFAGDQIEQVYSKGFSLVSDDGLYAVDHQIPFDGLAEFIDSTDLSGHVKAIYPGLMQHCISLQSVNEQLTGLIKALKANRLQSIALNTLDGESLRLVKNDLYKFWRYGRP